MKNVVPLRGPSKRKVKLDIETHVPVVQNVEVEFPIYVGCKDHFGGVEMQARVDLLPNGEGRVFTISYECHDPDDIEAGYRFEVLDELIDLRAQLHEFIDDGQTGMWVQSTASNFFYLLDNAKAYLNKWPKPEGGK